MLFFLLSHSNQTSTESAAKTASDPITMPATAPELRACFEEVVVDAVGEAASVEALSAALVDVPDVSRDVVDVPGASRDVVDRLSEASRSAQWLNDPSALSSVVKVVCVNTLDLAKKKSYVAA